ncbi:MAG: peptidylprolyl isomerase, partial [Syntrophales bacterium]|nr:peptidylprolyl isomerase [Syntrophales bacterium]
MAKKQWDRPPEMQIDPKKLYRITMETNKGNIELEFYPQHAPKTVNNFVFLTREGFYDGVIFHRVI